jgi:hypothetical protein
MIVNQNTIKDDLYKFDVTTVEYASPRDFMNAAKKGAKRSSYHAETGWAGGTRDYFERGLKGDVLDYCDAAEDKITQFGNVAIEEYERTLSQNTVHGVLDYQAAMAGNPACMFGVTIDPTDRSPVDLYIDPWVSGGIRAYAIQQRGIAILALVQALQMYRPVHAYILKGSHHTQARKTAKDTIQTLQIPTQPMDLARASFLLCSPTVNRLGFLAAIYEAHKTSQRCPSPQMTYSDWQRQKLGGWLAAKHGVSSYLYLHRMASNDGFWSSEERTIAWIKAQLHKFIA